MNLNISNIKILETYLSEIPKSGVSAKNSMEIISDVSVCPHNNYLKGNKSFENKLIIVDNEHNTGSEFISQLKTNGYSVVVISSVERLPVALNGYSPGVLILDYVLFDNAGTKVLKQIAQHYCLCNTRLIFTSNYLQVGEITREIGIDFIEKPYSAKQLIQMIKNPNPVKNIPAESLGQVNLGQDTWDSTGRPRVKWLKQSGILSDLVTLLLSAVP